MPMKIFKSILPYLILTTLTIIWWRVETLISNYAWNPRGKEPLMLDISLTTIFIYKVMFWLIVGNVGLFAIISSLKQQRTRSAISATLTVIIFFMGGQWVNKELAGAYFNVFRNQSVTEEYMEIPILKAGYHIGPELTIYIDNRSTDDRRYAISGLGKIKYEPATKTLERILLDATEPDYIRADALMSLKSIGTRDAKRIVGDFEKSGDKNVLNSGENRSENGNSR